MHPHLKPGQLVVFSSLIQARHGRVVLATINGIDYVKRLDLEPGAATVNLRGDNQLDSQDFSAVSDTVIRGALVWRFL